MTDQRLPSVNASAPGKVIILGEHFVVHGAYALAAAIEKRVRVSVSEQRKGKSSVVLVSNGKEANIPGPTQNFPVIRQVEKLVREKYGGSDKGRKVKIHISSDIPPGSGLGSSAAVSIATTAALGRFFGHTLTGPEILEVASFGEAAVHGNPSGIDTAVCLYGGAMLFSRENGRREVRVMKPTKLLVVYSGIQRRTGELVAKVAETREEFPCTFSKMSDDCSKSSAEAAKALERGNLIEIGALMNEGQARLSWVGASSRELDSLIESLHRGNHCYGAKLTGAGGGGSVIALPKRGEAKAALDEISKKYKFSFLTSIPQNGLCVD